ILSVPDTRITGRNRPARVIAAGPPVRAYEPCPTPGTHGDPRRRRRPLAAVPSLLGRRPGPEPVPLFAERTLASEQRGTRRTDSEQAHRFPRQPCRTPVAKGFELPQRSGRPFLAHPVLQR